MLYILVLVEGTLASKQTTANGADSGKLCRHAKGFSDRKEWERLCLSLCELYFLHICVCIYLFVVLIKKKAMKWGGHGTS